MTLPTIQLIRPGVGPWASLEVLRRRTYLRVIRLPGKRALVIGRLGL